MRIARILLVPEFLDRIAADGCCNIAIWLTDEF